MTPTWTWRSGTRSASTTTPGRSAWPAPGCWSLRRSPTSSLIVLLPGPARCGRATRGTKPPTSGRTSPASTSRGWTASSAARWRAAPGSEILTEEVFGPVLTVQTFASEAEAVALANGTRYGLAAIVFTGSRGRARRVSDQLVAGTVWVNCFFVRDLRAPFGGARQSGIGREGGTWSFDFYGDVKNTVYAPEGWGQDG